MPRRKKNILLVGMSGTDEKIFQTEHKRWENVYRSLSNEPEKLSLTDKLTGLYNKHYFETRLAEEIKRSRRYAFPLTLVFFNIEQFDVISGKYGAKSGNGLLRELAGRLKPALRGSDLLARVKNDRFAMLLPHTSAKDALATWQRIKNMVSGNPFTLGEENFCITLKGVMTELNREIEAIDRLIENLEKFMTHSEFCNEPLPLYLEEDFTIRKS